MTKPSNPRKRLPRCSSPIESFEAKYIPEPNSGCWLWFGCVNSKGYGQMKTPTRAVLAHRFAYEQFRGPLMVGFVLDHLCRQRCCVNPDHLEQVTQAVNLARGGRWQEAI
jgi:hypothetical protein